MGLFVKRTQTPLQRKAAKVAHILFIAGITLAGIGQFVIPNAALVALGVIIIAISLIPAVIAYPWILPL